MVNDEMVERALDAWYGRPCWRDWYATEDLRANMRAALEAAGIGAELADQLAAATAERDELRNELRAALAPGHTDLMVPPVTIGPWLQRQELGGPPMGAIAAPVNADFLVTTTARSKDARAADYQAGFDAANKIIDEQDIANGQLVRELAEARQERDALSKRVEELEGALQEISEGKGRYSHDQFEHACNTTEDMKRLALAALSNSGGRDG